MNTIPTSKITDNIIAIKDLYVNAFVYTKGSDTILIDAGNSKKKMNKELLRMNIDPQSISAVFLTHQDPDHAGGLSLFKKLIIYVGKDSKIKDPEHYKILDDFEELNVGEITIKAISTPGHRRGHTAYLIDNTFLFTGDLCRVKNEKIIPFIKIISSDFKTLKESIKKIAKLENIEMLFTAHGNYTSNFKDAINDWI